MKISHKILQLLGTKVAKAWHNSTVIKTTIGVALISSAATTNIYAYECVNSSGDPLFKDAYGNALIGRPVDESDAVFTPPERATQYPIILIHGMFGNALVMDDVKNKLFELAKNKGEVIETYSVNLPAVGDGETLGKELSKQVNNLLANDVQQRWFCEGQGGVAPERVHIIAHSLGTRATRALIAMDHSQGKQRVASATLIAGDDAPAPLMDYAFGFTPFGIPAADIAVDIIDQLLPNESFGDGFRELTTDGTMGFLTKFPDVEGFPYAWHGGRIRTDSVLKLGFWAKWFEQHANQVGPLVPAGWAAMQALAEAKGAGWGEAANDGVVTVNMAGAKRSWCNPGERLNCFRLWDSYVGVNHFNLIGSTNVEIFNINSMYRGIIEGMVSVENAE